MKTITADFESFRRALQASGSKEWLPPGHESLLDRFSWLVAIKNVLCPEYHCKWPQQAWWKDSFFLKFLEHFPRENGGHNNDRKWNIIQSLRLCRDVPGDTVECGCFQGASSWIILEQWHDLFKASKKKHFIFDSFEGLSTPGIYDGEHWKKHSMASSIEELSKNLSGFENCYQAFPGWIPDRFGEVRNLMFSFVHIDVDIYEPTRDSINFFYPRMNNGAILICDDYGFTSCPGATKAIDDFLESKPEKMLAFASGGGWFMKGLATSGKL